MGSVVLDAVNTFFGQSPSYTHPSYRDATAHRAREATTSTSPPPSKRSRTPSKGAQPPSMSQRATSASATRSVPREDTRATSAQRQSQSRGTPRQPAEPELGGSAEAPADAPLPGPAKHADVPRPTRQKIKVRDLEHIQSFASDDAGSFSEIRSRSRSRSRGGTADESPQYEISGMKVEHIIEMVAGLLTKITSTNDRQHEHLHGQPTIPSNMSHLNPQTTSVLAFHGKNVPSITILSYLSRINKYCPTSYEVFLSLLVYFDRMTERVNAGPMQSLRDANAEESKKQRTPQGSSDSLPSVSEPMEGVVSAAAQESTQTATPPASGSLERAVQRDVPGTPHSRPQQPDSPPDASMSPLADPYNLSHFFVVDSFNIHRLVIAGVTCASKFFSDIFYTNSRYAKVGGLPLNELNHLELQFLLLNDFRLSVPVEEIDAYGTMLVEFYAREIVAQKSLDAMNERSLSASSEDSTVTIRPAE
ncbi:hypothetical protein B0A48_07034 [Cryoendolithus antarcticus]|uniref:Cyclin-domain-containing protein n=1 Tax=Cryoendolithus antarcticus TaxID=1507870 RepID=A0A1V8T7F3_9PEZI|nr:hypothetical protein B0A48_07034 [Cryoendolithus antarcticus]